MSSVIVETSEELKKAIKEKTDRIIVSKELAKKIKKSERIKELSPAVLGIIGALTVVGATVAPVTGGLSFVATISVYTATAASTGLSIHILIFVATVGLSLLSVLFDEYTHVEVGDGKIIYERKKKIS